MKEPVSILRSYDPALGQNMPGSQLLGSKASLSIPFQLHIYFGDT